MADFTVTRGDLVGAAAAGHAGGAPPGELKLAEGQDPDTYVRVGRRTQVPSFSTGHGPSLEQMKQSLVIIEVEEEVEEIKNPQTGEVIDRVFHPRSRPIVPGDPDHPFVRGEAECPKVSEAEIQQKLEETRKQLEATAVLTPTEVGQAMKEGLMGVLPGKPPTQPSPTSSGDSALLTSVLQLVETLAQTQGSMLQTLERLNREKTAHDRDSTEPIPGSLPSSAASDLAPETSKESPSSSPQSSPSSTSVSPRSPMKADVRLTWHTPNGQFSCRAHAVSVQAVASGQVAVVTYLQDQENTFVPAASDQALTLEVKDGGESTNYTVRSAGLDLDLELADVGYKLVVLCVVE